jgi:hypothetical protein
VALLVDAYAQLEPSAGWPGWLRSFLDLAHPPHPKQNWPVLKITPGWFSLDGRTSFVLISSPQKDWANVFTSDNGNYDCYGYDLSKDRWAYEIESPNSERIREAVGCLLQEIGGLTNR